MFLEGAEEGGFQGHEHLPAFGEGGKDLAQLVLVRVADGDPVGAVGQDFLAGDVVGEHDVPGEGFDVAVHEQLLHAGGRLLLVLLGHVRKAHEVGLGCAEGLGIKPGGLLGLAVEVEIDFDHKTLLFMAGRRPAALMRRYTKKGSLKRRVDSPHATHEAPSHSRACYIV